MTESPKANEPDWSGLNLPVLTEVVDEQAVPTLAEEAPPAEVPEFDFSSELDLLAAELDEGETELEIPELTLDELLEAPTPAEPAGGLDFSNLPSLELADADGSADGEGLDFVLEPKAEAAVQDADGLAALMARADLHPAVSESDPLEPAAETPSEPEMPEAVSWNDVVAAASELQADSLPALDSDAQAAAPAGLPEPEGVSEAAPPPVEMGPALSPAEPGGADLPPEPPVSAAQASGAAGAESEREEAAPFTSISIDSLPSGVLGGGVGREPAPPSGLEWLSELPSQQQAEPPKPSIKDMIAEAERVLAEERAKQAAANLAAVEAFGKRPAEPPPAAPEPAAAPASEEIQPLAETTVSGFDEASPVAEAPVGPAAETAQVPEPESLPDFAAAAELEAPASMDSAEVELPDGHGEAPAERMEAMSETAPETGPREPEIEPGPMAEEAIVLDRPALIERDVEAQPALLTEAAPAAEPERQDGAPPQFPPEAGDALPPAPAEDASAPACESEPVAAFDSIDGGAVEADGAMNGEPSVLEDAAESAPARLPERFEPPQPEPSASGEQEQALLLDETAPAETLEPDPAAAPQGDELPSLEEEAEPAAGQDAAPAFGQADALLEGEEEAAALPGAAFDSEREAAMAPEALAGLAAEPHAAVIEPFDALPEHDQPDESVEERPEAASAPPEPDFDAALGSDQAEEPQAGEALPAEALSASIPVLPVAEAAVPDIQPEPEAKPLVEEDAVSTLYEAVPQPAPLEDEDMPALSGLLGRGLAAPAVSTPLAEPVAEPSASVDSAAEVSVLKVAAMTSAAAAGASRQSPQGLDEQALFDSLYEQMLPRMKVELSLWLQDAIEVQAKQMLSGMMHQLKEDYEMLFGDALKESLRQALSDAGRRDGEGGHE
ncbi:hypothetical protein [Chromobacterium violaceum]|uniref:Uncharacterized protein n=1 Tax=Chromobacterium violaceum TaxID=536 RepID=A0AAX2M663_CHRVL|nr:hypothetical protein [Chromobacterium violaceum]OLZ76922.1 hypothetical protein BS642_15575 [Chromobacterium violaceum]STB64262.1 Uncharacterised protein [Chromobacterium violaceum]SUX31962.1 Uncharacterised protein [Chromobacterium violaceum]